MSIPLTISLALAAGSNALPPRNPFSPAFLLEVGDAGTQVQAKILNDRYTAIATVRPARSGLAAYLLRQQPHFVRTAVEPLPGGGAEIRISVSRPMVSLTERRDGKRLFLEVIPQKRSDILRHRILKRVPRSAPSPVTAKPFRKAEADFSAGRLGSARERFELLSREYALRAWAQLRLADLELLRRDRVAACGKYHSVIEGFRERTAGILAQLRSHLLNCSQRLETPPAWTQILARLRYLDGPMARYLWEEVMMTISVATGSAEVDLVLALPRETRRQGIRVSTVTRAMQERLVARSIRLAPSPLKRASAFYRYNAAIRAHPESRALRLQAASAMMEVGLPDSAVGVLRDVIRQRGGRGTGALWKEREGTLQAARMLASAYLASGKSYLSRRVVAQFGLADAEVGLARHDRQRLEYGEIPAGAALKEADVRLQALRQKVIEIGSWSRRPEQESSL